MPNDLLNIASTGLMAYQRSLATVSHNISNVNTPGYSRQRTDLATAEARFIGPPGYVGNGVNVQSIRRSYDEFLTAQVRSSSSAHSELDTFYKMASQIDNTIADENSSIAPAMQAYFNSIHGVSNEPTSVPVRRVMLTSAETLVNRFNVMSKNLEQLRDQTDKNLNSQIAEVNAMAGDLANMNRRVTEALGRSGGDPPNDLLDQRDQMLLKLSEKLEVQIIPQDDGAVNVFIGSGQALVMGTEAGRLEMKDSLYGGGPKDIALYSKGTTNYTLVTDKLGGGEIGGYLGFRNRVLDPVQNDLGRMAAAFSTQMNAQHAAGYDLNGNTGNALFNAPSVSTLNRVGSSGLTATYSDINQLSGADYQVDVTAGNTTIKNLRTNAVTTYNAATFIHEGVSFDVSAVAPAGGASFLVQPTRNVATDMKLVLTDPAAIAASDAATTTPATPPGGPKFGNNKNALQLANLQQSKNLMNGRATYQEAYNEIVGEVGTLTKSAEINVGAQKTLLEHAQQRRDSVAGVNLDEEAANLIQFQQAYQAAAQTVATANIVFEALLGAVR